MAVRNFWISADIDGRKTPLHGGPVRRDGGFQLTVYMRSDGGKTRPVSVAGYEVDGKLRLNVFGPDGTNIFSHETER